MRKTKRFVAIFAALVLMLSCCAGALAASYTAATWSDLQAAFADNSGEDVEITLTADIDDRPSDAPALEAKQDTAYTIDTVNGDPYTLGAVSFSGSGTVAIDTDIDGLLNVGGDVTVDVDGDVEELCAGVNSKVTVSGDVGVDLEAYDNSNVTVGGGIGDDLYAYDDSTVTVDGDVGEDLYAYGDSTATVSGDVAGELVALDATTVTVGGNVGEDLYADEDSTVTVDGDVAEGLYAYGNSDVAVNGDVDGYLRAYDNSNVTVGNDISEDLYADGNSTVSVDGDINGGLVAYGNSTVTVYGDVSGVDGDPNDWDFDYSDPMSYADGADAIETGDNATVTVYGDVNGGNSYGTYGYGGDGIYAWGQSAVTVYGDVTGGDVIADPATSADYESWGGSGIYMENSATVTVHGDVTGGNTNGDKGNGGEGVFIEFWDDDPVEAGSLTVSGKVAGGSGPANGTIGSDLYLDNDAYDDYNNPLTLETLLVPEMNVGAYDSIGFDDFSEEEAQQLTEGIVITGISDAAAEQEDTFWKEVYWKIYQAEKGTEITVDAGSRIAMPAYIMDAIRACEVTLVIEWDGGDDIIIKKAVEFDAAAILLSDLAKLVK